MRDGIHVRYVGRGVREVEGVGTFQNGTVAFVTRERALELLREDCFVAEGSGKPVRGVILRIGQKPSGAPNPKTAPDDPDPAVAPPPPPG